jgi:hypothetical protein
MVEKLQGSDNQSENLQAVVRSFVVSLAPVAELWEEYQKNTLKPPILRFYLAQKGDEQNPRLTLFGGKIKPNENWQEATQREITEEIGGQLFGLPWNTSLGRWSYSIGEKNREVTLTYSPLVAAQEAIIGDDKIKDVKGLTLDQLKDLIKKGEIAGIPLEEHLTLSDSQGRIKISAQDEKAKKQALEKGINWMTHIEEYLQKRFEKILEKYPNQISQEDFKKEYDQLVSYFMRRGLETGLRQKSEKTLLESRHELVKALDSGFLGKDILYYLPALAKNGLNWPGLAEATPAVLVFTNFLKGVFNDFLADQGLTADEFQAFMLDSQIKLAEKDQCLQKINALFRRKLKEIFQVDDRHLDENYNYVDNFLPDLSKEMKNADPRLLNGLYQDFTLINEVNNAHYGYLLSLFLGYDTKVNPPKTQEIISYEAGRQLLLLMKGLTGIKYFQEKTKKIIDSKLQAAINQFFGPALEEELVNLGKRTIRVRYRQFEDQKVIIEEKPTKTFASFLRKSFEERIEDIRDFYNVNIVFESLLLKDNETLITFFDRFLRQFNEYLVDQYPDQVMEFNRINHYGTASFLAGKPPVIDGKRKGSEGNRLVRMKTIISFAGEEIELALYPHFSLEEDRFGYWGWKEKINDDTNYLVRRVLAGENGIPSFFDLLFSPILYPYHYRHRLTSNYHQ